MMFNFVKLWHLICISFCAINLVYLVMESYSIKHLDQDPKRYNVTMNFWLCTDFKEIKPDFEFFNDSSGVRRATVTVRELLNQTVHHLESKSRKFKFNLDECHVFNKHFCFVVHADDFNEKLDDYLATYSIKLFVFSDGHLPRFYRSVYSKKANFEMAQLKIHQQKFVNKNNPLMNCVKESDYGENTKFNCLRNCFGQVNSSNIYFDFGEPNREVDLKSLFRNEYDIEQEYRDCLSECKETVCHWETYNTITFEKRDAATFRFTEHKADLQNSSKIESYQLLIESTPSMDSADFWLQFVGLLTLFTGTSVVSTVPNLIHCMFKWTNKEQLYKKYFYNLKFGLITFSLIFLINQSLQFIETYHRNRLYPDKNLILNFSLEVSPISLVICVPIQFLISKRTEISTEADEELLRTLTFGEIESRTDDQLDQVVETILMKYGYLTFEFVFSPSDRVIFRNSSTYMQNGTLVPNFQRCFRVNINNEMNGYENMFTIASLLVVFKNENYEMFVLDERLNFASDSLFQVSSYKICKSVMKEAEDSLIANCTDYLSKDYCNSRSNCIAKCINKRFMHTHSNLSTQAIIDKDDFLDGVEFNRKIGLDPAEPTQSSQAIMRRVESSYFNLTADLSIANSCRAIFQKKDCQLIRYRHTYKKGMTASSMQTEIELYFEKVLEVDVQPQPQSIVLTVLNLEAILFGTNFSGLLLTFFSVLKLVFKFRWYRFYKYVALFICLIALTLHLLFIFSEIWREKLIDTGHFDRMPELQLPNLIFCFDYTPYDRQDENHLANGNYLQQLTQHLTFERIFDSISYYNKREFVSVGNLSSKTIRGSSNDSIDLELSYFFWGTLKCVEIDNRVVYKETDFFFRDDLYTVKLQFNERIRRKYSDLLFFYRHKGAKQLVEYYTYNLTESKYKVKFEMFELQVEDKFELLKNPKRLFTRSNYFQHPTIYLQNLRSEFLARYNLSTKLLPLEESDFNLEVNDEAFYDFYEQVQRPLDEKLPTRSDSKRTIYNCYEQKFVSRNGVTGLDDEPDMSFGIDFPARFVQVTNEGSFTKLVLNVLNSLSLCCNFCVLEFHKCVGQFAYLFRCLYRCLVKFRDFIKPDLG